MYESNPNRRSLVTIQEKIVEKPVMVEKIVEKKIYIQDESEDIDELLKRGLSNISKMMKIISEQATEGTFDRDTVQNLKDLMTMLKDLKKQQQDLLDTMSDAELEKLANEHIKS
jgi:hypothetical protein